MKRENYESTPTWYAVTSMHLSNGLAVAAITQIAESETQPQSTRREAWAVVNTTWHQYEDALRMVGKINRENRKHDHNI